MIIAFLAVNILGVEIDPTQLSSIDSLINAIPQLLMFVVGVISVIFIIVGGIQYITSAGNPTSIEKAKKTITMAVAGLVVAILVGVIINVVVKAITGMG